MHGKYRNYISAFEINYAMSAATAHVHSSYLARWREVEALAHRKCAWFARNRTVEREAHYRENNLKCAMMDYRNEHQRECELLILDTLTRMSERVPDDQAQHRTIRVLQCEWDFIEPFLPARDIHESIAELDEAIGVVYEGTGLMTPSRTVVSSYDEDGGSDYDD